MANDELFSPNSEKHEALDLKKTLLPYVRYWYLFLLGAIIGLAGAFLRLRYYTVPQYSVYSTLLIKDNKSTDALNDLSTFKSTRNIDNEAEVLKSKSLMTRVVTELNLFTSYYAEGRVRDIEIYGNSLPIKVLIDTINSNTPNSSFTIQLKKGNEFELEDNTGHITSHKLGQQIIKPYGTFTITGTTVKRTVNDKIIIHFQDIHQVADYYNKAIGVQPINKETSILFLSLTDPIPDKAKDIINKLMEVYNRESIEDKNLMTTNTLRFLDERLKYLTSDLSGVEMKVQVYKSTNGLTDISTQASNYTSQVNNYDTRLSEWAIQIDILESLESYLRKNADSYSMVPSTLGIKDETLGGLLGKFNELQLERERMLRTTQPGNPLVQNINEQLTNLRVNILENLRNIKRGLQITSNNLKASSGQFQSKVKQVPAMERKLLEINRQQSIKQNIYSYLLQKREETALTLAATASVSRVLDPAMGGDSPINLNGNTIYLMALLLGLGIPFAGIYIAGLLNNKVQTQQDVTAMTSAPIIGEIAHNTQGTIVVAKGNRSPIAEMFRLVRANLNFATLGKENMVLLVTSGRSGEGKTFFSINLAASLAITDKRVVLLDLDLRNPKVAKELKLTERLGITNYLIANDISINDIIRPSDEIAGLSIISSGSSPPNPAELMMSAKFANLIHELRANFDYVIIDTPPVGQVADAFTLNSLIDFTIYMVRYNYTQKNQLEIVRSIHDNQTLKNAMIVLNDAKEANGSNYGYGYGYGYEQQDIKNKVSH